MNENQHVFVRIGKHKPDVYRPIRVTVLRDGSPIVESLCQSLRAVLDQDDVAVVRCGEREMGRAIVSQGERCSVGDVLIDGARLPVDHE